MDRSLKAPFVMSSWLYKPISLERLHYRALSRALRRTLHIWLVFFCFAPETFLSGDWLTFGHDPQRSGWTSRESKLSVENVARLELKWKSALKNEARSLTALTAPLVLTHVMTPEGVKDVVYVAGSSNHLFALEAQNGKVLWSRTFETAALPKKNEMWLCPQGLNATPVIDPTTGIIYALAMDGRLFGLDVGTGKTRFGPIQFVPPFSKNWSLNFLEGFVYTSLSQGCGGAQSGMYAMEVGDPFRPIVHVLLVSENGSSGIWGRGGPVIGGHRRIFATTGDGEFDPSRKKYGNSVIAASLKDLKLQDYFTPSNWRDVYRYDWDLSCTSPVWFAHKNRNLLCAGGKEGVLYLLDADELGKKDHHSPLFTTSRLANDEDTFDAEGVWGGLSAWQDETGESWLYAPIWGPVSKYAPKFPFSHGPNPNGSIMAFRVRSRIDGTGLELDPAWVSGDFSVPEPVVIANGVVFGLSNGENTQQSIEGGIIFAQKLMLLSDRQRIENPNHAVLYALDAKTGKTLYESGSTFDSWVHFSGLAVADGSIYAVDYKSQVYCFGLRDK